MNLLFERKNTFQLPHVYTIWDHLHILQSLTDYLLWWTIIVCPVKLDIQYYWLNGGLVQFWTPIVMLVCLAVDILSSSVAGLQILGETP
jgi:hypothetical protein